MKTQENINDISRKDFFSIFNFVLGVLFEDINEQREENVLQGGSFLEVIAPLNFVHRMNDKTKYFFLLYLWMSE